VAVDHPQAKNLIGAFYHPRLVIADSNTMRTLSPRDYRAGVAEVVKHGVITDPHLFDWLEGNRKAVLGREPEAVAHMVRRSCEIKATVVARDERESGLRATLNFGHTIGHALESLTSYRVLRHGEAVAIGMVAAARLACALGLFSASQAERVERLLSSLRLPTRIPRLPVDTVLSAIRLDKKAVGGAPRFVLPVSIGRMDLVSEVSPTTLRKTLLALGATAEL
jgi:3-dehydroquinate synthase